MFINSEYIKKGIHAHYFRFKRENYVRVFNVHLVWGKMEDSVQMPTAVKGASDRNP
jgi:hypothetical protein